MAKHFTKSKFTQDLPVAHTAHVKLPLPMLSALEDIDRAFFGICVEAGKQVLGAMMEHDRTALCGLPWKPDEERPGRRAGSTESPVTLGGRRIAIRRPRVRSIEGGELVLPSFEAATDRDPLDHHTLEAVAAGVSTRRYARSLDRLPPTETERSTSRSAVSRRFVALTEQKLGEWISQPLAELDLKIVMLDGIHFRDHCILVALGFDSDGKKHPLGIREGNTENAAVARALLADLVERGLSTDQALVFVIDGSKALRQAIDKIFGDLALIQRCPVHKRQNVLGHLAADRSPQHQTRAGRGMECDGRSAGAATSREPGAVARTVASGCGRLTSRGLGGHSHPAAPRSEWNSPSKPPEYQRDREPERQDRNLHTTSETVAGREDDAPLGRSRPPRRSERLPPGQGIERHVNARRRTSTPRGITSRR